MELTAAELTILGLVIEKPMHGYDLEHVIELRGIRQWTDIGFSSIYYLLTKLEKRSLVQASEPRAGGKSRRVYHATPEGRDAEARPVPQPFLAGLANLPLLTEQEFVEALRVRLAQLDAQIAAIEGAERSQVPLPQAAREVFSYSLSLMKAERSWLAIRVQAPND